MERPLFQLNPALDRTDLASRFAHDGRVQVRNFMTAAAAAAIADTLQAMTPWGVAWQAGAGAANFERNDALRAQPASAHAARTQAVAKSVTAGDYGFQFASYPMLDAYLGKWNPDGVHDLLIEHINDQPFLDLVRTICGIPELAKADAQATLYAPGHFLAKHDDSHVGEGWRIAYVINMCPVDWKPDWGGYLNFLDADGDVVAGWKPRFNCLNLFSVPQAHQVTFVPPFAPVARYAITGWFRDR